MAYTVLLGDPSKFRIKSGSNPHTRDAFGFRKKVDPALAMAQWLGMKKRLEEEGVRVEVLPADPELTGMVFPANAGFRYGKSFYLSNLNPARAAEKEQYRRKVSELGLTVKELPSSHVFEGEADFFPVGDPSGDSSREVYLFTYGHLEPPRWKFQLGFPPYRRVYGFRSDYRILPALRSIVHPKQVMLLELADEAHYHGDTVLYSFGPRKEFLMAYLEALKPDSRKALQERFGDRLIPLSEADGRRFAANSFQFTIDYYGRKAPVLMMPDGLTLGLYQEIRKRGVTPCPIDVSEFLEKGGGAVKCMVLDLGEL